MRKALCSQTGISIAICACYSWGRQKSEELGLKVYLCVEHHRTGLEAVHRNIEISRVLQQKAQQTYEQTHSHAEWMQEIGRNYDIKTI